MATSAFADTKPLHVPVTYSKLPTGWSWTRLDDLCEGTFDCPHSTPKLTDSGPFVVRTQDIITGIFRPDQAAHVSEETYAERTTRATPTRGDLLYSREGTYFGIAAEVPKSTPMCLGQRMVLIRPNTQRLDFRFLRYWLNSPIMAAYIHGVRDGSVAERLNLPTIRALPVLVPTICEQKAIADMLSALDDKIELSRKMSATLEAVARSLFKSWFVDFDPVRAKAEGRDSGLAPEIAALFPDSLEDSESGNIPTGWLLRCIADMASVSRATVNPLKCPDEVFEHYSIPAYDTGSGAVVEYGAAIKSNKFVVLRDAVLLSRLNPRTPRVWMPWSVGPRRAVCSTEFAVMLPKMYSKEWLYCLFSSQAFCEQFTTMVTGTSGSHQRVKPESLLAMPIIAPTEKIVALFTRTVASLLSRIALARSESLTLATLRDTLLPQLISGDIRLTDAERILEKSA